MHQLRKWIFILVLAAFSSVFAQQVVKRVGEIKYISQQSYYINLGSNQGLSVGDTLIVKRNSRVIGRLVVENIARHSAACKKLNAGMNFQQRDRVEGLVRIKTSRVGPISPQKQTREVRDNPTYRRTRPSRSARKAKKQKDNDVSGRFGLQTLWFKDHSGSNLDYRQIGLRSKIRVQRLFGSPLELQMRWRSRSHHRDRVVGSSVSADEWTHRVQEFSLRYTSRNSPYEFGVGRLLAGEIRGLGYIDGGMFSVNFYGPFKVGVIGGMEPGLRNSGFQTQERKFGAFVGFQEGDYNTRRIESTFAFSGSYHSSTVSREFMYVQNSYSMGSRFSVYQTMEFDLNRGWKNANNAFLQLTNFFLSARYSPTNFLSVDLSYDARKAVKIYETRSIPDSLFDETTRQGMHAGVLLRFSRNIRLSTNFGLRLRKGNLQNTRSMSSSLTIRRVLHTWTTVNARFSYFSTMFSRGYRPNLSLRVPMTRKLSVNFSGGMYIYQIGGTTTQNKWFETLSYYRISRRFYTNLGYRLFIDEQLKSGRVFLETGVTF